MRQFRRIKALVQVTHGHTVLVSDRRKDFKRAWHRTVVTREHTYSHQYFQLECGHLAHLNGDPAKDKRKRIQCFACERGEPVDLSGYISVETIRTYAL